MNLYLVISETLSYVEWEDWFVRAGHKEYYRICELVVARDSGQARWIAWRNDTDSFTGDVRDMPKFTVQKKKDGVDGPARVASEEFKGDNGYQVWLLNEDAPHIGIVRQGEIE